MPTSSYATSIPGVVPSQGLGDGFRGHGKLRGQHRELWRAACAAFVDAILGACNDKIEGLPLFSLLSPHQRVRLLREVAVGLICEDTALPPDTVWHFSAYMAPLHYVAFTAITVETDTEGDHVASMLEELDGIKWGMNWRCDKSGNVIEVNDKKKSSPIFDKAEHVKLMADSEQGHNEENAMRKHQKSERKKAGRKNRADLVAEIEGKDKREPDLQDLVDRVERMATEFMEMKGGETQVDRDYAIQQKRLLVHSPWAFKWRRLLRAFFREWSQETNSCHLLELVPSVTETDRRKWEIFYCWVFGGLLRYGNILAKRLIFGSLDEDGDWARHDLVLREVKRSSKLFQREWTKESSIADVQMLTVLQDPNNPFDGLVLNDTHLLGDDERNRAWLKVCFLAANAPDEEALNFMQSPCRQDAACAPSIRLERARAWSWAHIWHEEMQRDPRGYQSSDARLRAVFSGAVRASTDDLVAEAWQQVPYASADYDIVGKTPGQLLDLMDPSTGCDVCGKSKAYDGVDLRECPRCEVSKYCSTSCQKEDWKVHRSICNGLKSIAEDGEGAAVLPNGVFLKAAKKRERHTQRTIASFIAESKKRYPGVEQHDK